jgi:hypothetical protein
MSIEIVADTLTFSSEPVMLDESIDRTQGSTHLPAFPRVDIKKPKAYNRSLTMNDVPDIRLALLSMRQSI